MGWQVVIKTEKVCKYDITSDVPKNWIRKQFLPPPTPPYINIGWNLRNICLIKLGSWSLFGQCLSSKKILVSKGRHKKTAERVKLASFALPLPPLLKEWKTKEWNIGRFEAPSLPVQRVKKISLFYVYCNTYVEIYFWCLP